MHDILKIKLHRYIEENNPDLLMQLEEEARVTGYLSDKISIAEALLKQLDKSHPAYITEEEFMDVLTRDLRPSKFNYICAILLEEFEATYEQLKESGILQFEVINLVNHCQQEFEEFGFAEGNESNRHLQYCITGAIGEYLESKSEFENLPVGRQV